MIYRALTNNEITQLEQNGCQAQAWNKITVSEGFNPARVKNIDFAGTVRIGAFSKDRTIYDGIMKPSGLYQCHIQNCIIHDDVYISNVKFLANYEIFHDSVLHNISALTVSGETGFGNGVKIEILNEGGGRELPIFDKLSAQIAYMMVTYRHDHDFIDNLKKIIKTYTDSMTSKMGTIGNQARILNSGTLHNISIGDAAYIEGVARLEEGTIASTKKDPIYVGSNVIAKNFIILSGSIVDSGTLLTNCFVGQGVQLGKQFSAEHSAFFANCEGFHSETCSVFAGPYSVTHHKSTLLIAGMFSFYNAGSGTNQSNHMYKLGPVHQGVLERGSKTGSYSYLLWPVHIGAFSTIIGKHYANFDSSDLPFSYITEVNGKSVLKPAMNLLTVGTRRDSMKWPKRDRRKDPIKYDLINFDLLSPFIIGKAQRAIQILSDLYESSSRDQEFVFHKGINIKRPHLKQTSKYYEMIIQIYMGEQILKKLSDAPQNSTIDDIKNQLLSTEESVHTEWVDLAGLVAPKIVVASIMSDISNSKIKSVDDLVMALNNVYTNYDIYAWNWCADLIMKRFGKHPSDLDTDQLVMIIEDWLNCSVDLNNLIIKDAEKEFTAKSQISFGLDGDEDVLVQDFAAVRGSLDNNTFVKEVLAHSERIKQTAGQWLKVLT